MNPLDSWILMIVVIVLAVAGGAFLITALDDVDDWLEAWREGREQPGREGKR